MPTRTTTAFASWLLVSALSAACGDVTTPSEQTAFEPLFPADYAASYVEVRDCRRSGDHDLNYVRILADQAALEPYQKRSEPFPVGAVVLKVEHADEACGDITGYTAMRREETGYAPDAGDWHWQRLDRDRVVKDDGKIERCTSCHALCGVPPDGFDWTCSIP